MTFFTLSSFHIGFWERVACWPDRHHPLPISSSFSLLSAVFWIVFCGAFMRFSCRLSNQVLHGCNAWFCWRRFDELPRMMWYCTLIVFILSILVAWIAVISLGWLVVLLRACRLGFSLSVCCSSCWWRHRVAALLVCGWSSFPDGIVVGSRVAGFLSCLGNVGWWAVMFSGLVLFLCLSRLGMPIPSLAFGYAMPACSTLSSLWTCCWIAVFVSRS